MTDIQRDVGSLINGIRSSGISNNTFNANSVQSNFQALYTFLNQMSSVSSLSFSSPTLTPNNYNGGTGKAPKYPNNYSGPKDLEGLGNFWFTNSYNCNCDCDCNCNCDCIGVCK